MDDNYVRLPLTQEQTKNVIALGNIKERDEDIYAALMEMAVVLKGKNENYVGVDGANAFDNFETVSAMKTALYRGMPVEAATSEAAAVLDQILHKIVRLVRGAEWNQQVGEGTPDAARDLNGYSTLLNGMFKRRARLASPEQSAATEFEEWDALRPRGFEIPVYDRVEWKITTSPAVSEVHREFTTLELALAYQTCNHDDDPDTWDDFRYVRRVLINERGVRESFITELADTAIGMLEREFTDLELLDACVSAWCLSSVTGEDFSYVLAELYDRGFREEWHVVSRGLEADHA